MVFNKLVQKQIDGAPPERINARRSCSCTSNAVAIEQLQLESTATDQLQLGSTATGELQLRSTATGINCNWPTATATNCNWSIELQLDQLQLRSTATAINCNWDQLQLRPTATKIICNCDQLQLEHDRVFLNTVFHEPTPMSALDDLLVYPGVPSFSPFVVVFTASHFSEPSTDRDVSSQSSSSPVVRRFASFDDTCVHDCVDCSQCQAVR